MNLTKTLKYSACALVFIFIVIGAGCAGKDKPSPVDLKAQAFDDLRTEIQEVVSNPERAEQAIAITQELETAFYALREHRVERSKKVKALNSDYDASREDFLELFSQIQMDTKKNQKHFSELHRKLISVTTEDEWTALLKYRNSTIQAAINAIQTS